MVEGNDTIKNLVTPDGEGNSESNLFLFQKDINPPRTTKMLTIGHLKIYVRLRFSTYSEAGRRAGLSSGRVKQIVNGFSLPEDPEVIKRIASGWDLDSVVLAQLFDKYRGKK